MSTIRTAVELEDNFTNVLYQIIDAVNLSVSAMEQMQTTMNNSVDMTSIEMARNSINQATTAVHELNAAMQNVGPSEIPTPTPIPDQHEPVEVPVQWQSDTMNIFTDTGIDRFRQEVQSTNTMLEQLSATQDAIARQAYNTNILPPGAFQDLNHMATRIDWVRNRIQTIESNPLNMGTDAANAELEILRGQLDGAIREQQNLNRPMTDLDVQAANEAYLRLQQIIGNTERHIRDNVDEQGRFNREIEEGTNGSNELTQMIKGAVAAYATIQTLSAALNLSDQLTSTTARLNMMNDGLQTTQDLQDMIYLSAERSRGSYQATADAVSKLGLMAGDAFGSSEEIVAFMEQVNKQFTIAGTEAAGIDAAMLQLTQAMGSGVLRGEEYNSILEQAPNIIQTIADYMDVPKGQLKDMAAEGQITADIVKAAMFAAADETNEKFESMPMTFEQIGTSLQNTALMSLQPLLESLNKVANSDAFRQVVNHAASALSMLVTVANPIIEQIANTQVLWDFANGVIEVLSFVGVLALNIFSLLVDGVQLIADNWSWLSPIIYGVAGALAVYYGWVLLTKGAELGMIAVHGIVAVAKGVMAAATMLATGATWAETTAQYGLNAAMYACPIVWIIILIIALIAAIFAVCNAIAETTGIANSGFGVITGGINVVIQFFKNLGLTAANIALGIGNAIAALGSNMMTAFHNAICSVQSWFYNLLSTALSVIEGICAALNKLPFVEFDYSGISSAADDYAAKAEEAAGNKEEYKNIGDAFNKGFNTFDVFQDGWVSDAFDAGAAWGDGIADKVSNFSLSDLFGTDEIPNPDEYVGDSSFDNTGAAGDISDISGNTGSIKDSLDVTEEDLKYLRDIAEQETINRFTTAEVKIDMSGMKNTIKNGMDLDGVVNGLTDVVNEAAEMIAEGVH